MARIISVISATGGSGKSFVSCNIASELKKNGASVLLAEFSLLAPTHDIILGASMSVHFNIGDILSDNCTLLEAVTQSAEDDIPDFIAASPTYLSGDISTKKLFCSASREYDYMLIDIKAADVSGFDELIAASDTVLVVLENNPISIRNTALLKRTVASLSKAEQYAVLNKVTISDEGEYLEDILDEISMPILGIIPYDEYVLDTMIKGDIISRYDTYAGRAVANIAKRLSDISVPDFETGYSTSRFKKNKFIKKS